MSNIETPAFGFGKKLIIARNAGIIRKKPAKKKKKDEDEEKEEKAKIVKKEKNPVCTYLEENIDLIQDGVILVIIEDNVDVKSPTYIKLEPISVVSEMKELTANELTKKICNLTSLYGVKINMQTAQYVVDVCGTSMQVLLNEIRKLIEYAGKGGTITKENVDLLCTKKIESRIFDVIDCLGNKNITGALEKLDDMLYQKEPIQKIIVTLYGHFKKLYIYKISKEEGRNIAADLNLKNAVSFQLGKFDRQARCFSKSEIKEIMFKLMDLDSNSKIGNIDSIVGLKTIFCRYCGKE